MPYIFLQDIPLTYNTCCSSILLMNNLPFQRFTPNFVGSLRNTIARAAETNPEEVKIFLSFADHLLLPDNGYPEPCNSIRGSVVWYGSEKRDLKVKQMIADALQNFLNLHNIGKGFDLTFMDMPAGSFFVEENGKSTPVPGGDPTMPFSKLYYTVNEKTGFTVPGRDPDDVVLD